MPEYVVTSSCYVPFGDGRRYKRAGQNVTMTKKEAEALAGYVEPVGQSAPSQKKKRAAAPKVEPTVSVPQVTYASLSHTPATEDDVDRES